MLTVGYFLSCGCWKDNEYNKAAVGKLCGRCGMPFRKKRITSMRMRMMQIPTIKILGVGELSDRDIKSNKGYIDLETIKRTKYIFDSKSNKVKKILDHINKPGEFDKQPDVYEYMTSKKLRKK